MLYEVEHWGAPDRDWEFGQEYHQDLDIGGAFD
jgi:hypothetical protein